MNTIKSIQALNKRELEDVVPPTASWHTDYRDTAYLFVGGLSFDLSEGDLETIFAQYGVPTWIKLARDKESGKSRGFGWLKYEDQRSCDLAVDNLGGATVLGRMMRVDHTRYKKKEGEEDDDEKYTIHFDSFEPRSAARYANDGQSSEEESVHRRPKTKAEEELHRLVEDHDEEDPMKEYLLNEKRKEVAAELAAMQLSKHSSYRRRHRHDREREGSERKERKRKSRIGSRDGSRNPDRNRDRSSERRQRSRSPGRSHRRNSGERRRRSISRDHSTERRRRR